MSDKPSKRATGPTRRSILHGSAALAAALGALLHRRPARADSPSAGNDPTPKNVTPELPERLFLPMASGAVILRGSAARIVSRPQRAAFRPARIIIGSPEDWVINDVQIDGRSQLREKDISGNLFSLAVHDLSSMPLKEGGFDVCPASVDFAIHATYVGPHYGSPFFCGIVGDSARWI